MRNSSALTARKMARAGLCCALACLLGCARTRTVYVPDGEPVRLREPLKKVKIWALDKDKKEVPGEMDLPEGWYALPDPDR